MDLSDLINAARGDRSFRDLERLSALTPKPLSYGRWQQMASGRPALRNFPDPDTIQSLATTLGVTERVVVLAAAESLGLNMTAEQSPLRDLLPAGSDTLTPRQMLAVLAVVQAFLDPGLPDPADDVDEFVLPDVTAPEPPHEPTASDRARQSPSGHGWYSR